jgi:hypothetical protein
VSTTADLRRLDFILSKLTGDKRLRDEAQAIVRGMIDAQARENTTTEWWAENGPTGKPLSGQEKRVVDFVVVNGSATKKELARHLGVGEDAAYRYVSRANTHLHDEGGKASISWDGSGAARTATISVVVSSFSPPAR